MLQNNNDKSIRAFLACSPSQEVRGQIISLQETFQKQIPSGAVAWVKPEGIHLTLKFLGYISPAQEEDVRYLVAETVKTQGAFHLSAQGAGAFPTLYKPKVIWMGLGGETESLLNLQRNIDLALTAAGFPQEDRPFQGHLTLGRVKKTWANEEIKKCLTLAHGFTGGQFSVDHLSLFKSDLTPNGAIYTTLHIFPLAPTDLREYSPR